MGVDALTFTFIFEQKYFIFRKISFKTDKCKSKIKFFSYVIGKMSRTKIKSDIISMILYVFALSLELRGKFGHCFEHCFVFVFGTGGSVF